VQNHLQRRRRLWCTVTLAKGADVTGTITVQSSGTKKGELVIKSSTILVDVPRKSAPLDLVAELIDLRRDLEALKDKVAKSTVSSSGRTGAIQARGAVPRPGDRVY